MGVLYGRPHAFTTLLLTGPTGEKSYKSLFRSSLALLLCISVLFPAYAGCHSRRYVAPAEIA